MKSADEIREFRNYLDFLRNPHREGRRLPREKQREAEIQAAMLRLVLEELNDPGANAIQRLLDDLHRELESVGKRSMFLPE